MVKHSEEYQWFKRWKNNNCKCRVKNRLHNTLNFCAQVHLWSTATNKHLRQFAASLKNKDLPKQFHPLILPKVYDDDTDMEETDYSETDQKPVVMAIGLQNEHDFTHYIKQLEMKEKKQFCSSLVEPESNNMDLKDGEKHIVGGKGNCGYKIFKAHQINEEASIDRFGGIVNYLATPQLSQLVLLDTQPYFHSYGTFCDQCYQETFHSHECNLKQQPDKYEKYNKNKEYSKALKDVNKKRYDQGADNDLYTCDCGICYLKQTQLRDHRKKCKSAEHLGHSCPWPRCFHSFVEYEDMITHLSLFHVPLDPIVTKFVRVTQQSQKLDDITLLRDRQIIEEAFKGFQTRIANKEFRELCNQDQVQFLPPGHPNHNAELMYLSVSGELWGIAIVCLDQESMIADIEYPACFNGKSSAAQLLINELYSLMIRKGAGVIQCKAPWSKKEQMAAVNFFIHPSSEKNEMRTYFRYSERYMETIAAKVTISKSVPSSEAGRRQGIRLQLLNAQFVKDLTVETFLNCPKNTITTEIRPTDSVQTPGELLNIAAIALGLSTSNFTFIDGCVLQPHFDADKDANFFTRLFPRNTIVYVNPPYFDLNQFIIRCYELFAYFGMNVVLLVPRQKFLRLKFAQTYITPIAREVPMHEVSFRGYGPKDKPVGGLSMYFLLQQNFTDFIAQKEKYPKNWKHLISKHGDQIQQRTLLAGQLASHGWEKKKIYERLQLSDIDQNRIAKAQESYEQSQLE